LLWRPHVGALRATIVCKVTFELRPGEAILAPVQRPLLATDVRACSGSSARILEPADLIPRKALCDVVLVGHAFAPAAHHGRSLTTRLAVGDIDKSIELLRPSTAELDESGGILAVEYGPLAPESPVRFGKLRGEPDALGAPAFRRPLDPDLDFSFFNVAPPDQQTNCIAPDAVLFLLHLTRAAASFGTRLPGVRPRALWTGEDNAPTEVELRCDTLWIDTDHGVCTTTWRGEVELAREQDAGTVFVMLEPPHERLDLLQAARANGLAPVSRPVRQSTLTLALPSQKLEETVDGWLEPRIKDATPTWLASSVSRAPAVARGPLDLLWFRPALGPEASVFEALCDPELEELGAALEELDRLGREEPRFRPPWVTLQGELRCALDPKATLRAALAASIPFVSGHGRLSGAVATAKEVLAVPGALSSLVVDGCVRRLREAFPHEDPHAGFDYLERAIETDLVRCRRFQAARVFGERVARGVVAVADGREAPIYLPWEAVKCLPMLRSLPARILAEVRPPQEGGRRAGPALRILAVARVLAPDVARHSFFRENHHLAKEQPC
jgi:hypothetical protein